MNNCGDEAIEARRVERRRQSTHSKPGGWKSMRLQVPLRHEPLAALAGMLHQRLPLGADSSLRLRR
eukprot:1980680-Pyramimonas_sp.AAC.2